MIFIAAVIAVLILAAFPKVRCVAFHPVASVYYGVKDLYFYFKLNMKNLCPTGSLVAYVGLFGKGKTLSAVHQVVSAYRHYDGLPVWCSRRHKMVTQRIKIISNVSLSVPYESFVSLEQIVLDAERKSEYDDANGTLTVTLVLGDEFSVQLNSRNFKKNIDPLFLNTLLTCRHYHISLFYTAQRFMQVDALLRQVTSYVVDCDKTWRIQGNNEYDAWEMENAANATLLTPLRRHAWFVRDRDYEAYDTLACVGNLKKDMQDGNMMSETEILALQQNQNQTNMDGVVKPSRRWQKSRKKKTF
ncbi:MULTISPECIES: zonular occludens toxin domain-containing protein [unclassified Oscillibacter]|uniref:zonular occludens toxin domain-containing protein n=1 Tax=unclassified Oscillibacter TaxID=2629304 RepID=UPI0025F926A9|nr:MULTISPECIES: zonular occludens toxin domain-containing protein [unclassified Oscillibacter]